MMAMECSNNSLFFSVGNVLLNYMGSQRELTLLFPIGFKAAITTACIFNPDA